MKRDLPMHVTLERGEIAALLAAAKTVLDWKEASPALTGFPLDPWRADLTRAIAKLDALKAHRP